MEYQEKIEKLRKYMIKVDRLRRKCREADLWDSMTEGKSDSMVKAGAQRRSPDAIKETAIQIRRECEELAAEAAELRRTLVTAIECLQDDTQRDILEKRFLEGKSIEQIAEEYGYCARTIRRRFGGAVRELERCTSFFG